MIQTYILFIVSIMLRLKILENSLTAQTTATHTPNTTPHKTTKYVIVGGGISALQTALILAQNDQDFMILQAGERLGGRICSLTIGRAVDEECFDVNYKWLQEQKTRKLPIECGATWVSENQHFMKYFMKLYGLTLYPQYEQGKFVMGLDHKNYLYLDSMGQYYNQHKDKINQLLTVISNCTRQLEQFSERKGKGTLDESGQREYAAFVEKYDSISALDFIREVIKDEQLSLLLAKEIQTLDCVSCEKFTAIQLFCNEEESGLANIHFYVGALNANIDGFRAQQGMTELLNRMKTEVQRILDSKGKGRKFDDMIRLSTPVVEVLNHQTPVLVKTQGGQTYSCEKAIICLPVGTMGRIKFSSLSTGKKLLVENQLTCNMTRMAMVFAKPWWRPNHCGYVSFSHKFPMNELVELTPKEETIGILAFVFTADGFEEWDRQVKAECGELQGEALRKKWYEVNRRKCMQIIADLYLKGDVNHKNLKEVAIFAKSLSQSPYIKSTYQAATAPGVYSSIVKNREDCWAVHQSEEKNLVVLGSDFSDEHAGYMEGAIRHSRRKIYGLVNKPDPLDYLRKEK